ncbi:MAG: DUF4433 domain-containing protein [candidate division Zixibacteria bacterium]|nr:DUF4433 domain-containing protein [candidate division Zixibacteria bacterium]
MNTSFPIKDDVRQFIDNLRVKYKNKRFWPNFLFHYTDIDNIPAILMNGYLLSRNNAKSGSLLKCDSASQSVLQNSPDWIGDFVRLYFRPKTPPLWHIEGFTLGGNLKTEHDAHCPVPVYLLFSSKSVLSIPDMRFSEQNLALQSSQTYDDTADLSMLDFSKIYHDDGTGMSDPQFKRTIVASRCAEVVIPRRLSLDDHLAYLVCRSDAERVTLLNLLDPVLRAKYGGRTKFGPLCFHRRQQFVTSVNLRENGLSISYNKMSEEQYQYMFEFCFSKGVISRDYTEPQNGFSFESPQRNYTIIHTIDGHIAYKGKYEHVDLPF